MTAPQTFSEVFQKLKAEAGPLPETLPSRLSLTQIRTAVEVFQPRDVEANFLATDSHVKTLTEAVRDAGGSDPFDPIQVWWSGQHWYVLDGHHRLMAYVAANGSGSKHPIADVAVSTFTGTLEQAIAESAALNAKDKLPMTKKDKLERAWKMVCLGSFTQNEIKAATTISIRTVATMREAVRRLNGEDQSDLLGWTWQDVLAGARMANKDDEWQERQAKEWVKGLVRQFGKKLATQPEIAARALELYSGRLPVELVRCWPDAVQTVADEEREAGF